MDGIIPQPVKGPGGEPTVIWGSYAPNGTSNPLVASNGGPPGVRAFTTVYSATGVQTITLPVGITPVGTPTILVSAQAASLAAYFEVMTVGAYSPTTRSFVVQQKQGASGVATAAAAGARVHFALIFNNSGV